MRRGVIMGGLIAFPGRGSEVPGHLAIPPEAHRRGALVVSEHLGIRSPRERRLQSARPRRPRRARRISQQALE